MGIKLSLIVFGRKASGCQDTSYREHYLKNWCNTRYYFQILLQVVELSLLDYSLDLFFDV
jgi:hypothetical protein